MSEIHKNILTEILLELTLTIGNEQDYTKIIQKTIPLWLKRLNCSSGAIITIDGIEHIVPAFKKKAPFSEEIQKRLQFNNSKFELSEIPHDGEYHYLSNITADHIFYFVRSHPLNNEHTNEIKPILKFFGRSLINAMSNARLAEMAVIIEEEKHRLQNVIANLPDAIFLKDLKLRKILSNEADLKFSGFDKMEDILYKTDMDIYPQVVAEPAIQIEQRIIEEGYILKDQEVKWINKEGEKGWLMVSKFPMRNKKGDIIGLLGMSKDITELKNSQEKIERLSLVASQTDNGVVITDVVGHVEWTNEGFTRLTGYKMEEMLGKIPGKILQGEDSDPEVIKIMSTSIQKQSSFDVELINYRKDGTPYWVNIVCNPLYNEKGNIQGYMSIQTDITDKVIFREELIRAKQIAENAEKAEKAFLANMSHEIRTPLNAIIGMTSLLKDTDPSYEQSDYIETLDYSSKFLLALINDILDLAKIESGKMHVRSDDFDLSKCLKNIHHITSTNVKKKNVTVSLEIGDTVPQYVKGDEIHLQQILNNILGNAVKFTDQGVISMKVHEIKETDENHYLQFEIKDSGVGISEANLSQIFEKFQQINNSETYKQGTGLGLTITKDLIELMGGQISVSSAIGIGTTFTFKIPFAKASKKVKKVEATLQKATPVVKESDQNLILIVEDNLINQKYITRLLEKNGLKYDLANNGNEAVDQVFQAKYDLIFMDIQMPEMDGFEATRMIRTTKNLNHDTPIIALTASNMLDHRKRAKQIGMNGHLSKPFSPIQLKELLSEYDIII